MADLDVRTMAWVKPATATLEPAQLLAHALELGDPSIDLSAPTFDEIENVATGRLPPVAKGNDSPDLPQLQPHGLGRLHEGEAIEDVTRIVPVARVGPGRWLQNADLFVVPEPS